MWAIRFLKQKRAKPTVAERGYLLEEVLSIALLKLTCRLIITERWFEAKENFILTEAEHLYNTISGAAFLPERNLNCFTAQAMICFRDMRMYRNEMESTKYRFRD